MRPRSSGSGRNTDASVTATVTVTVTARFWRERFEAVLAVLACALRTATKKSRQLFRKTVHPVEKILATPMAL